MKKALLFLVAVLTATFMMSAQDKQQDRDQVQLQEHLMLKDGIMYQMKGQDQIQLKQQLKLQNGATVNPDGSYQLQNKKQMRLKNGECLDMDGNQYKNQQEFGQQMQIRANAMAQEHFMYQNGQMYRIRNQEKIKLNEAATLQNGTKVNPDGNIQQRDKKQIRMQDGECLDMDGNHYATQDRYREKMEKQERERMGREQGKDKSDQKGNSNGNKGK